MQELIIGYMNPQQLKQINRPLDRNFLSLLSPEIIILAWKMGGAENGIAHAPG